MMRHFAAILVCVALGITLFQAADAAPPREIVIAVPNDVVSLDPFATNDFVTNQIMTGTTYETLVTVGTKGDYEPSLAASWKIIDQNTWEFHLRPGVRFTNGEPLTAETVKLSLERCLNPDNHCPRLGQLSVAKSVDVVDPLTVRIHTVTAFAALPSALMYGFILPMRALAADPAFLQKDAVGTGPMRLVDWRRGQRLVFERNEGYWGKKPVFRRIVYRPIPDEVARVAALQAGEVQLVTAMPPEMVPVLMRNPKTRVDRRGLRMIYIGLDTTGTNSKALADVRVRQAMNYAINKDVLINKVLEGNAEANVGGMMPPAPGFDRSLKPYPYDPARARQLLTEAGYPNGFDVTFNYVPGIEGSMKTKEVAEALASDLQKTGIRVTLAQMEAASFWSGYFARKYQMYLATWGSSPEAGLYYRTLLHSKTRGLYYRNAKADEMIDTWFAALDPAQRAVTGRALQHYVNEQAPFLFLFDQFSLFGLNAHLTWVSRPAELIWTYDLGWKD